MKIVQHGLIAQNMMFKNATNEPVNYECLQINHKSTNTMKVQFYLNYKTNTLH